MKISLTSINQSTLFFVKHSSYENSDTLTHRNTNSLTQTHIHINTDTKRHSQSQIMKQTHTLNHLHENTQEVFELFFEHYSLTNINT